ncbi:type I methionyl aminopeptidase [Pectinatus cerevisiiphilus]|uniref:Methionine aminopeptidase n=1 Tax=Pectinatus cerevisiiphilus TaxID=86956 RepID=A0A4R3K9F4_9FIRM|nr:type I methionyl aminopeptidase [Pectinatus cerevisiiphilus]TCS79587.1 methionyl aminopeptidase [Pectinatus cerevisiiphilus]
MHRNDVCWCGSGLKYKRCHLDFDERIAGIKFDPKMGQIKPPHEIIKNEKDIEGIIKSGKVNNATLDLIAKNIKAGIDTLTLNDMAHNFIIENGGIPACLNYAGYPKSICISINNVVCHGIPSKNTILRDGDIVNVDITTILDGYFADASRMFMIGNVSDEAKKLVEVTRQCMELGINAAKPWHFLGDVGAAIEKHAHTNKYSVVTALGGHGVGKKFHEEPFVSHVGEKNTGMLLVPGMVLTVEPMINAGTFDVFTDEDDGWTVYTKDGELSAQWEKTILITETGNKVLAD